MSDPYAKIRNRKLGDSQMIIKNCQHCGADVKLKRDVKVSISCYPCIKRNAVSYQLNNPHAGGYLGRTYISRKINNYGKVVN